MYVHNLNFIDIIRRSPQAHLWDKIKERESVNVHISDIMRPFILTMYGGAYRDSDTVSLKSFPSDIHNFLVEGAKLYKLYL